MQALNLAVYALAVLTCFACTALLFRDFLKTGYRMLLWSTLCFVGLTVNNLLLFFDLVVFVDADLRPWRLAAALAGLVFLLYSFIFESE
jgi:hypothetical protein